MLRIATIACAGLLWLAGTTNAALADSGQGGMDPIFGAVGEKGTEKTERQGQRQKQRVESRVDREADEATDRAVDKALDSLFD